MQTTARLPAALSDDTISALDALPGFHVDLIANTLFATGGWVPSVLASSWLPRNAQGWFPATCHVLRSDAGAVLIDTGLVVHKGHVGRALEDSIGDAPRVDVLLTRREPDTIMNLPWIARQFRLASVRCSGPVDPFDYVERLEEAMTASQMRAMVGVPVSFLEPAASFEIAHFQFSAIRPAIRVLATDWFYEHTTRTLFSSDTWAFASCAGPGDPILRSETSESISVDRICDHLAAKFDWLIGIDTDPVVEKLDADLAALSIDRICPDYGCIIEGRAVVEAVLANTKIALRRLKDMARLRPLATFRWPPRRHPEPIGERE